MKLKEWREKQKAKRKKKVRTTTIEVVSVPLSQEGFAAKLNEVLKPEKPIRQSHVSQWELGMKPRKPLMDAIIKLTGGKVTINDF